MTNTNTQVSRLEGLPAIQECKLSGSSAQYDMTDMTTNDSYDMIVLRSPPVSSYRLLSRLPLIILFLILLFRFYALKVSAGGHCRGFCWVYLKSLLGQAVMRFLYALLCLIPTEAQSKPRGASLCIDVVILLFNYSGFKAPAEKGGAKAIWLTWLHYMSPHDKPSGVGTRKQFCKSHFEK